MSGIAVSAGWFGSVALNEPSSCCCVFEKRQPFVDGDLDFIAQGEIFRVRGMGHRLLRAVATSRIMAKRSGEFSWLLRTGRGRISGSQCELNGDLDRGFDRRNGLFVHRPDLIVVAAFSRVVNQSRGVGDESGNRSFDCARKWPLLNIEPL